MTPENDKDETGPTGGTGSTASAPSSSNGPAEKPGDVWEAAVTTDSTGFGWADVGLFKASITEVTDDQNVVIPDSTCGLEEVAPGVTRVTLSGVAKNSTITIRARSTTLANH